jgi:hypothetical protein
VDENHFRKALNKTCRYVENDRFSTKLLRRDSRFNDSILAFSHFLPLKNEIQLQTEYTSFDAWICLKMGKELRKGD